MRPTITLFIVLCSLLLCGLIAPAQDLDNVTISGRVTDEAGALVVGASVTAVLTTTNTQRTVKTDTAGLYRLIELAPGAYTIKATSPGFAVEERTGVVTIAGQNAQFDFVLRPAGV